MAIRAKLPGNPKTSVPYEFPSSPRETSQNFKRTLQLLAALEARLGEPTAPGDVLVADPDGEPSWGGGTGSGVDADTLDGIDSTGFSLSGHLHDDRYYTEAEVDAGFQPLDADLTDLAAAFAGGESYVTRSLVDGYEFRDAAYVRTDLSVYRIDEVDTLLAGKQPLDADLTTISGMLGTGYAVRTGDGTWASRAILGTANQVVIVNGSGAAGSTILSTPQNLHTAAEMQLAELALGVAINTGHANTRQYIRGAGSAGTLAWAHDFRDIAIFENDAGMHYNFIVPNDQYTSFMFSDPDAREQGYLLYFHLDNSFRLGAAAFERLRVTSDGAAGDIQLMIYDVTAGSIRRVSRGAVDSGGAGFRALRIPN